jgi:hypothetical protein
VRKLLLITGGALVTASLGGFASWAAGATGSGSGRPLWPLWIFLGVLLIGGGLCTWAVLSRSAEDSSDAHGIPYGVHDQGSIGTVVEDSTFQGMGAYKGENSRDATVRRVKASMAVPSRTPAFRSRLAATWHRLRGK